MMLDDINVKVISCLDIKTTKTWRLCKRRNSYHKLLYIHKNKGSFVANDVKSEVSQGQLIYSYPGMLHSASSDQNLEYYAIHFWIYQIKRDSDNNIVFKNITDPLPIQRISHILKSYPLESLFKKILNLWKFKQVNYQLQTDALLSQTIHVLLSDRSHFKSDTIGEVRIVLKYIQKNFTVPITIDSIMNQTKLSKSYFLKTFKEYTGYTITEYIRNLRIEEAKKHLVNSNKSIKEIAQLVGYEDEFYFSRIFKIIEHLSPHHYRQKH